MLCPSLLNSEISNFRAPSPDQMTVVMDAFTICYRYCFPYCKMFSSDNPQVNGGILKRCHLHLQFYLLLCLVCQCLAGFSSLLPKASHLISIIQPVGIATCLFELNDAGKNNKTLHKCCMRCEFVHQNFVTCC